MDVMDLRRNLLSLRELPSAYQRIDYLQSTGTQYINTGVIGTPNIDVRATFELNADADTGRTGGSGLLGSRQSSDIRFYLISFAWDSFHIAIGGDKYCTGVSKSVKYNYHIIVTDNGYEAYVDGQQIASENVTAQTQYPLYLFACNNYGTVARYCKAKLYKMQIMTNGRLIRDFVPCYKKTDNVAGLYDIINGVFYTNSGTGAFVVPS